MSKSTTSLWGRKQNNKPFLYKTKSPVSLPREISDTQLSELTLTKMHYKHYERRQKSHNNFNTAIS